MAKQFGKTWWGEQWLNSLKNIDFSNRLPRGSSYARKGAVESIKITENKITAKVAGSRKSPYKVDIILPPFFDPALTRFIKKLGSNPNIISKLLNRELDPMVMELAEEEGLKVFPTQWTDFKMNCSCPDWAVPCKHLAAVIYKVSAEIDNNPFLAFELHKVDLIAEFYKLGIVVNKECTEIPKLSDLLLTKGKIIPDFLEEQAYQKLAFSKLKDIHLPLVSLLADDPVFYNEASNFKTRYQARLSKVVKLAKRVVAGKMGISDLLNVNENAVGAVNTHSTEQVVIDENYKARVLIDGNEISLEQFVLQLAKVPSNHTANYQPSTAALHSVLYYAIHLLANGAITPQIVESAKKGYLVRWLPAALSKEVRALTEQLETMLPLDLFVFQKGKKQVAVNRDRAENLLSVLLTELISLVGHTKNKDVFLHLFYGKETMLFEEPGEESLPMGIASWVQKYYVAQGDFKPHLSVQEAVGDSFQIEIGIQETKEDADGIVSLSKVLANDEYQNIRYDLLKSISMFSSYIPGLDGHIESKAERPLILENSVFSDFLMNIIPAIQLLDIQVLLPKSLQDILKPKTSIKLKTNKQNKSFIRLDEMLSFDWQIALGDNLVGWDEFKKLSKKSKNLIKYKTNYIYVDENDLQKLVRHFTTDPKLNAFEMLRAALSGEYMGARIDMTAEVRGIIEELSKVSEIALPVNIHAQLRPYQLRGYSWMYRNSLLGFGSVLADDMGLGKTLQVICLIQKYKEQDLLCDNKALVVAPTGLLHNWQSEIQKFAPKLKAFIYHGPKRNLDDAESYDVIISSYGVVRSIGSKFKKKKWSLLIIDEAQNIKNSATAQSKAVKSIAADNFIAMSGTPVENRLSELWSIMDYSNRGYLGSVKTFNENFGIPIEVFNDTNTAEKLRNVTAPFMMRRLKTDKSIISDLPDKIEIEGYATLTKQQASLYAETLKKAMADIDGIESLDSKALFKRQGLVLQMIMALKQICNHPTQFLKNKEYDPLLSGKIEMLFNTLDNILENNEKVLIFTQFKEMGMLLQRFITERYEEEPLFYHGGSTMKQRSAMVESFQNNRANKVFILSLKAAGTGLNLTAARHVIHYDLWWNPAVEAQATDRAYRIGQKNNVMVHRFITKNTFEEQINEMIQSKKALAEMTIATGENWIGNMSNKELKELFTLR